MADGLSLDVSMTGDLANLEAIAAKWHYKILLRYIQAATQTLEQSQIDVPVLRGDLKDSGTLTPLVDSGPGPFEIGVSYGDGSSTSTIYDYPESDATTQYPAGDMEADGYSWFTELGHDVRGGNYVPAQAYLGSNFDIAALGLEADLIGILDK